MSFDHVAGQQLYYEDTRGAGLPVVLGHGFLMDSDMFRAQVEALRGRHRVVVWDQRGHGRTVTNSESWSYWDSAADLAGLLDHLGIQRAVVGGMSQGGFIALRFALAHPQRTAGLVLIDTQAGLEDPTKVGQYDAMHDVWTSAGANDQLLEMVGAIIIGNRRPEARPWIAKWRSRDPALLTPSYRTLMDRDDVTGRLGEIKCPAVVIHGADDVAIEITLAEQLCAGLSGCTGVVRIEGAGHDSSETHPEPANRAIAAFLDTLS